DGDLALILDAAALADIAGITESQSAIGVEGSTVTSVGASYLHVALRDVPAAIPIEQVEHVVSVQASDIQSVGGVLVLRMEEEILPLLDGVRSARGLDIDALIPATVAPAHAWHVLVCRQVEGRMGLLVSAVYGMVQAEALGVKNVEHPEEPGRSVLCIGDDLVRVIEPMDWRHFLSYPEDWTKLSRSQWQEMDGTMSSASGTEARR
ncbi:MAG TPA: hypothetical protein VMU62_03320, partial [Acidobacteriaceae bacterium]|nr:hypothetical protein [Acidobacteriaceae bacterium]